MRKNLLYEQTNVKEKKKGVVVIRRISNVKIIAL